MLVLINEPKQSQAIVNVLSGMDTFLLEGQQLVEDFLPAASGVGVDADKPDSVPLMPISGGG